MGRIKIKIMNWYKEDKKLLAYALVLGLVTTLFSGFYATKGFSDEMQSGISKEVIRFHVRANSDSQADQNLKVLVKDRVLEKFHDGLSQAQNIEETRDFLNLSMNNIENYAEEIIEEQGYDYTVKAGLTQDFFPTKVYGDVAFPPGEYEALRIDIGQAAGENWWCVMFPPLCFVDVTQKEIPEKEKLQLKNILTDDEYDLVTKAGTEKDLPIKIKFKIVELWQGMKEPKDAYVKK